MKPDAESDAGRAGRSRSRASVAAVTTASSLLLASLVTRPAAGRALPAASHSPFDAIEAGGGPRVVSLVLAASPENAASLRLTLTELTRRLGLELREHGGAEAWAELAIELPTTGSATVILREARTRRVRLQRKLREVASAQVLVETAATIAHAGLETMIQEAPPEETVAPPMHPPPSRRPPERRGGGAPATASASSPTATAEAWTEPPPRSGESRVESAAPDVLTPALPPAAIVPAAVLPPAVTPAEAPAAASAIAASASAVASPAPPPRSFPVRVAVESTGAFDTERPSWGVGLAASASLPTAPLAPRLALGGTRWQRLEAPAPPDRGTAGLVVQAELTAAVVRTASVSWHLGPVVSWRRQTITTGPPYPDQRLAVGQPIGGPPPEPGPAPVPNAGAPADAGPGSAAPFAAAPASGEVTRNVFDYGLSSRLALRLGRRSELFAGAAAITAHRFGASDPARAGREGEPLGATRTWTLLTSIGFAVVLSAL